MKITIESHNEVFTWKSKEHPNDQLLAHTVVDVADKFKGLLVAAGYHPDNVDEVITTGQEWFSNKNEQDEILLNEC